MHHPEVFTVIEGLSKLVFHELTTCASEQKAPMHEADQMDSIIRDSKDKAKVLRELREEFENVMTGIIF
jgi:hypothetical protein